MSRQSIYLDMWKIIFTQGQYVIFAEFKSRTRKRFVKSVPDIPRNAAQSCTVAQSPTMLQGSKWGMGLAGVITFRRLSSLNIVHEITIARVVSGQAVMHCGLLWPVGIPEGHRQFLTKLSPQWCLFCASPVVTVLIEYRTVSNVRRTKSQN